MYAIVCMLTAVRLCLYIISQTVTLFITGYLGLFLVSTKEQLLIVLVYFLPTLLKMPVPPLCSLFSSSSSSTQTHHFFTFTINFQPLTNSLLVRSSQRRNSREVRVRSSLPWWCAFCCFSSWWLCSSSLVRRAN